MQHLDSRENLARSPSEASIRNLEKNIEESNSYLMAVAKKHRNSMSTPTHLHNHSKLPLLNGNQISSGANTPTNESKLSTPLKNELRLQPKLTPNF